ncbi:hypothetical protein DFP72DRAFT_849698 [Ephemerocybe angulata]|uniref:Uncharacterized protein n=1 Tax=Ephemerocybe angulata TaxID=980116 RepID=A0A8H6HUH8_9AGAR|nr:hypothetical protein DFP72DRAFT_849698 [Tulosesus angulatus]
MPRSRRGLAPATRRADTLVAAICFIGVFLAGGDLEAFWTMSYLRWIILWGDPPSPPDVNRLIFTQLHRMHIIINIYDLAVRRRRRALAPRPYTNAEWAARRERLREDLRDILSNEISLERYLHRPITMSDEPIFQTLYGTDVPRHVLRPLRINIDIPRANHRRRNNDNDNDEMVDPCFEVESPRACGSGVYRGKTVCHRSFLDFRDVHTARNGSRADLRNELPPYRVDSLQLITIIENVDDFEEAIRSDRTVAWLEGFLDYWFKRWPVGVPKGQDRNKATAEEKLVGLYAILLHCPQSDSMQRVYQTFAENTSYARAARERKRLYDWGKQVDIVFQTWLSTSELA